MYVLVSWEESSDSDFRSLELGRRLTTFHFCAAPDPRRDRQIAAVWTNIKSKLGCFSCFVLLFPHKYWKKEILVLQFSFNLRLQRQFAGPINNKMFLFSTYKGNVKIGQVKRLLESVEAQIMGNCLKSPEKADISFYFYFPALLVMRWQRQCQIL